MIPFYLCSILSFLQHSIGYYSIPWSPLSHCCCHFFFISDLIIFLNSASLYLTSIVISVFLFACFDSLCTHFFPHQCVHKPTWIWYSCPLYSSDCMCNNRYCIPSWVWLNVFYAYSESEPIRALFGFTLCILRNKTNKTYCQQFSCECQIVTDPFVYSNIFRVINANPSLLIQNSLLQHTNSLFFGLFSPSVAVTSNFLNCLWWHNRKWHSRAYCFIS